MATTRRPKLTLCPEKLPSSQGLPRGNCGEDCPLCNNSLSHIPLALLVWLSQQDDLSPETWDALQRATSLKDERERGPGLSQRGS
jgi:hypothetical protein